MKLKLDGSVISPQDLKALIQELKDYAAWSLHANIKKRAGAKDKSEPPVLSPAAISLVKDWAADKPLTPETLNKLIDSLEEFCEEVPSMTITLAAPPSNGLKQEIVSWCRNNIEPNILVNFQFNSTLLGGMLVRYKSHIFDWSFRRQILNARENFPEVLRRV